MPATYTHAIYGEKVLALLDLETKNLIKKYRNYYDIGLSGPDILFFYRPIGKDVKGIKEIGNGMHEIPAREFFTNARQVISNSINPDAALAYIFGFINHFVLDSYCHPMINELTKDASVLSHSELESEFDAVWMREKGLNPIKTKVCEHIHPSKEVAEIIAPFFNIKSEEVLESLRTMKGLLNLFVAPGESKRKVLYAIMKKVGAYEHYQGLIFNKEARLDTIEICKTLQEKLELAKEMSVKLIDEYKETLNTDVMLDSHYDHNYES